jgi:hypothetical protein
MVPRKWVKKPVLRSQVPSNGFIFVRASLGTVKGLGICFKYSKVCEVVQSTAFSSSLAFTLLAEFMLNAKESVQAAATTFHVK